jgi:hypothetical protein
VFSTPKIIATGICAAAVAGGAVAAVAADAAPAATTHTIRLVVSNSAEKTFGKNGSVSILDQVDRQNNKVVGYTVLRGQYGTKTGTLVGTIALKSGTFNVRLTVNSKQRTSRGTITGGSSAYAGAKGSVSSREATSTQAVLVLRYTV